MFYYLPIALKNIFQKYQRFTNIQTCFNILFQFSMQFTSILVIWLWDELLEKKWYEISDFFLYIKWYEIDAYPILGNSICMYASWKIGVASWMSHQLDIFSYWKLQFFFTSVQEEVRPVLLLDAFVKWVAKGKFFVDFFL